MRRLLSGRASPSTRRIRRRRLAPPPEVVEELEVLRVLNGSAPASAARCRSPHQRILIRSAEAHGRGHHDHRDDRGRARRVPHARRRARRSHPVRDLCLDRRDHRHVHPARSAPARMSQVPRAATARLVIWEATRRPAGGNWDRPPQRRSSGSPARWRRDGRHRASRGGSGRCASECHLASMTACYMAVAAPRTSAWECRLLLLHRVWERKRRDAVAPHLRSPASLLPVAPAPRRCRSGRLPA